MRIFVTGTDTDVGKTLVCTLLSVKTGYHYWKPIQTGSIEGTDSEFLRKYTTVYPESYIYKDPVAPYLAAHLANQTIDISKILIPKHQNLIIEGAGGALVPINNNLFIADLIKLWDIPTLIVARSTLGTINHTLMTIESLRNRGISLVGVIMNGQNQDNADAIEYHGKTKVLIQLPWISEITLASFQAINLNLGLLEIFKNEK